MSPHSLDILALCLVGVLIVAMSTLSLLESHKVRKREIQKILDFPPPPPKDPAKRAEWMKQWDEYERKYPY